MTVYVEDLGWCIHLKVWREDQRDGISWDELQQVKNEIIGHEFTAIEIYPPQSELVDELNMRHLWVLPEEVTLPTLRK